MRLVYLLFFACAIPVTQETAYLDLVNKIVLPRHTESTSLSGTTESTGAGDGADLHLSPPPLQLTILNVEGAEHKIGENLIYEVKILNISGRTLKIPWVFSPRDIEPSKPGPYEYQMASLSPRLFNSSGQVAALEAVVLYGSDAPSTMLELAPDHWVRMRAKSRLYLPGSEDVTGFFSVKRDTVRFEAVWSPYRVLFADRNGQYHETMIPTGRENPSANNVPIHIVFDNEH